MTVAANPQISIDLGRHRSFCALVDEAGERLIPLSDKRDGLVLRWLHERGSERVTERVLRQAEDDPGAAAETVATLATAIFPELAEGQRLATSPWIAIPPAFGPTCRAAVCEGFDRAGVSIQFRNLVDRPIAGLAGWVAGQTATADDGAVLVIDNDGGQLSAAAADLDQRRLLFSVPLSVGPDDVEDEVEARLRVLVEETHRLRGSDPLITLGDWSAVVEAVRHVVLTGSASRHPDFLRLIERVLPDATLMGVRSTADQAHTVAFGLLHVDALAGFTACWPTGSVSVDGQVVRQPGPVRGHDIPLEVGEASVITFTGPDGDDLPVEVGSVSSFGVAIPAELGPEPRLRLLSDGRILVLGPVGSRPLSLRVRWPVPTQPGTTMPLEVVGRRSVQLTDPRVALRRRATVGS